jgi:uncharacterized radical SAM superfamily protein
VKWDVRLEVGNYCNLRCPLCVREILDNTVLNSIHLPLEDVRKFLPRFFLHNQVSSVFLSGAVAEPTLNPEFIEIVKYLMKYSEVVIDSNGSTRDVKWWAELGATGVHCDFAPDSIKPNNNKYRINSNTDKVIENMRAFVAAGGSASWKFIPYTHNEDEMEEQKCIAQSIGAKFTLIQPRDASGFDNVKNSSAFADGQYVESYVDAGTPHSYCKLFGNVVVGLIEISPEGIVYPCCMMPRQFYTVYRDYFANGITTPNLSSYERPKYQSFIDTVVSLIEDSGGIESLSLYKHSITDILKNKFYTNLQKSWDDKAHFCNNYCDHAKYKLE